jgi:hypothetical protein
LRQPSSLQKLKMYGRGRGYQLLNNATSSEVNNSIRNEEELTSETVSEIVTIPASIWQRELSPPRPVLETVQRLTEWSFRRMEEDGRAKECSSPPT